MESSNIRGLKAGPRQRVALVNMPFAGANRPSIQCGLLKAGLVREGHQVDVHYLNLELAAEIGEVSYRKLSELRWDHLLGEWLFSTAAFGPREDEEEYREAHPSMQETLKQLEVDFDELRRMRNEQFPQLIARWAGAIDWGAYGIVGFTSSFEQNVSSLALARQIKKKWPEVVIVFGGANFDGEMGPEYVRAFPWIDYAVVGEGDQALPALVDRIGRGESPLGVAGVAGRVDGAIKNGSAPIIRDLDALPDPDYDDFFTALMRLGRQEVLGESQPLLLFESARGCWWGAKHHCTFCGLNTLGMAYRSKSPERLHAELRRQSARYQIANFEAVDNILDMRYLEALCRPLIEDRVDYSIFYEVKANLKREQLYTLSRAGISILQPGIESLSTHVLKLMRKGTTMLQNVRLMKWAHYYGIKVAWNLLTGFPGETLEDYEAQAELIPKLVHLPPPTGGGSIWMERFSPYFTEDSFPVSDVEPWKAYSSSIPGAGRSEDRLLLTCWSLPLRRATGQSLPHSQAARVRTSSTRHGDRLAPDPAAPQSPRWKGGVEARDLGGPRCRARPPFAAARSQPLHLVAARGVACPGGRSRSSCPGSYPQARGRRRGGAEKRTAARGSAPAARARGRGSRAPRPPRIQWGSGPSWMR